MKSHFVLQAVFTGLLHKAAMYLAPETLGALFSKSSTISPPPGCFQGTASDAIAWCQGKGCCDKGPSSCDWDVKASVTICENSCQGDAACWFVKVPNPILIEKESCVGMMACYLSHFFQPRTETTTTTIGPRSCLGHRVCEDVQGSVGEDSCFANLACGAVGGDVGSGSCQGPSACLRLEGFVQDYSCHGAEACSKVKEGVGNGSCRAPFTCDSSFRVGNCVPHCEEGEICKGDC